MAFGCAALVPCCAALGILKSSNSFGSGFPMESMISPLKTIRRRMTPIKMYSRLFMIREGVLGSSMVPFVCEVAVSFVRSSSPCMCLLLLVLLIVWDVQETFWFVCLRVARSEK